MNMEWIIWVSLNLEKKFTMQLTDEESSFFKKYKQLINDVVWYGKR